MISMMTFCSDLQELLKFKRVSKDCVAKLCEDEWIMEFYQCLEKFKERIKDNPKLDMICYDIENEKGISYASYLRKCYEQAYLILMADMNISPMDYIRPDIMPEGLIVTPASDRDIIKVLRRVFETYLENMNKNNIKKSYIVANTNTMALGNVKKSLDEDEEYKEVIITKEVADKIWDKYDIFAIR